MERNCNGVLVACQIGLGITSADYSIYSIVPAQQGGLWYYCSITSLYHVRTSCMVRHAQRLETSNGQRRGSHQDDQGD